jgi:hypothetical protein
MTAPPHGESARDGDAYLRNGEIVLYHTLIESLGKLEGWSDRRINELLHMLEPVEFGD